MTAANLTTMPVAVLVNDDVHFTRLCEQWPQSSCLGIDTEFIRTNTFYARLGLLQLRDLDNCYLVDPLQITNWGAFTTLLKRSDVTTVLHSCSEDLNLLYGMLGAVPAKIFDTQYAAAFLGHGYSISYQALVKSLLNVELAKGETRSDWLQRPLTPEQLNYATADVHYLLEIYETLKQELRLKSRLSWFETDCVELAEGAKDFEDQSLWPEYYKNIHGCWNLGVDGLAILQKLCVWREQEARRRDRPRNWILKDAELLQIAESPLPGKQLSLNQLTDNTGIAAKFCTRYGQSLVDFVIENTLNLDPIDPKTIHKPLSSASRKKLKLCQQLVKEKAGELAIAPELLGRKRQLVELIRGVERDNALFWPKDLRNWRKTVLESSITTIFASDGAGGALG